MKEVANVECCDICCETFNKTTRRRTECSFCANMACVTCVKRYMLSSVDDPHCMKCRCAWHPDFVDSLLTKAFRVGPLRKHREAILYDRERSMMPETQPQVERIMHYRRMDEDIAKVKLERAAIDRRIRVMLRQRYSALPEALAASSSTDKRQFVKPCPSSGCRGFLSTAYKCGICMVRVCPTCHEIKSTANGEGDVQQDHQHVCDQSTVETVRAIARDSKPCPKCGCMIFRIDGCSQMFCTAPGCCTAFDWVTGKVVTGRIHNPHYYEFMQRGGNVGGRELDDIPCGGMPDPRTLKHALEKSITCSDPSMRELMIAHNLVVHISDYELRRTYVLPNDGDEAVALNRDIRVKFMMKHMDEDTFRRALQSREKKRHKITAINQVLSMLVNVSADTFRNVVNEPDTASDAIVQMRALRKYVNETLEGVSRRFDCVVPYINIAWILRTGRTRPE